MEQLGLAGMPQRLYRCTPTRLAAWLDCPRRYRMTYLDRPAPRKGPPWAHNSLGASVHNALAGWWRLPLAGRSVSAAGDLLERGWIEEGFADQAQSTAARSRARRMVEHYVAGLDPGREPVGVERTVATRTDRIAVSGRIDRLDERPEDGGTALVVVDYKTGRRPLTTGDARASMPLALYAPRGGRGGAGGRRPGGRRGCCGGPAAGWNCTTCRPGRYTPGSTRTPRWPGTSAAPRISPRSARMPTSGSRPHRPGRPRAPPARRTRAFRQVPAPAAAGAISVGAAPRAARQRRPAAPGTGSAQQTKSRPGGEGGGTR